MKRENPFHAVSVSVIAFGIFIAIIFSSFEGKKPVASAQDGTPPEISNVKIIDVSSTSAVITWETDELSDSVVNFGISKQLGIAREPNPSLTTHEVVLTDLEPATTYYFRVSSADSGKNQSFSGTFNLLTKTSKPIPDVEKIVNAEQRATTERIAELIDQVSERAALEVISDQLAATGESTLTPPKIVGEPRVEIEAEEATVYWETDREADGIIEFASEAEYSAGGGYSRQEGNSNDLSLIHSVTLHGLKPETLYHYRIMSRAKVGPAGTSDDKTFRTKSIKPQIFGIRLQKIEEDSATITWSTQVPAAGLVEYTNLNTKETKSIGNPSLQAAHTIRLPDLKFKSPYSVLVKARTISGDEITSQPITFVTVKDDSPPIISQVSNESTLYPGADAKVQTLVSWETDELAICQLFYGQGLGATDNDAQSLPEGTGLLTKHVQVIVEFTPSTVYKFWVRCRDRNDNPARSEDFVLFTPEKEKNIIDIILENFEGTFGWVKNIGK